MIIPSLETLKAVQAAVSKLSAQDQERVQVEKPGGNFTVAETALSVREGFLKDTDS